MKITALLIALTSCKGAAVAETPAIREAHARVGATPGIDPKRIVLLGHSQGGFLAPRMAKDVFHVSRG
jgi:poly(3-hydroxybutyrate) depolymerase